MPPRSRPTDLTLNLTSATESQPDSSAPNTSPIGVDLSSFGGEFSTNLTSLPPLPSSPSRSPRHQRDPSKNILSNFKSRISPEQEQRDQIRQVKDDDEQYRPGSSSMSKIYHLRKNPGSTPELSLVGSAESIGKQHEASIASQPDSRPQPSPHHSEDKITSKRKDKPFRNPLGRSKSIRRDSHSKSRSNENSLLDQPPKTAPISADWPEKDMVLLKAKGREKRGKSAERAAASESDENTSHGKQPQQPQHVKEKEKENQKSGFISGSKNVVSKAKTGGGAFFRGLGKIGRSSSNNEKEVPDSEYVCKVIGLPLVEQARITRISKDLSSCRDKTEYWMPSLPWRCIDYLNLNCESEGLYRVPGSGPQVKHWQRRFDTELDVDLLDEQELYDPNTIGSMLKSWLRDLPTDVMPKEVQSKLAKELEKENPEYQRVGQPVPQKLRDTLSELPPFNYYLLFAITCHLSLLLSHKEKNKMDLYNLNICIGPPLRLERWLFNYLVGDWRHCWQGCFTEKQYLDAEKAYEEGREYQLPTTRGEENEGTGVQNAVADERAVSSSGSGSAASKTASHHEDGRPAQNHDTPEGLLETKKPETHRPAPSTQSSHVNGNVRAPQLSLPAPGLNGKRPSTADEKAGGGDESKTGTPRYNTHNRTKSDLPSSPVQGNTDVDFPFPMSGGRA